MLKSDPQALGAPPVMVLCYEDVFKASMMTGVEQSETRRAALAHLIIAITPIHATTTVIRVIVIMNLRRWAQSPNGIPEESTPLLKALTTICKILI